MNEARNSDDNCAEAVPSERERLLLLMRIAEQQWPLKSDKERAFDRKFIERDYQSLTGCRVSVKS